MDKGFNLRVEEFRRGLVDIINGSGMPVTVARMVLSELLSETLRLEQAQVERERQRLRAEEKLAEDAEEAEA